jgi:hypothetical protein
LLLAADAPTDIALPVRGMLQRRVAPDVA